MVLKETGALFFITYFLPLLRLLIMVLGGGEVLLQPEVLARRSIVVRCSFKLSTGTVGSTVLLVKSVKLFAPL